MLKPPFVFKCLRGLWIIFSAIHVFVLRAHVLTLSLFTQVGPTCKNLLWSPTVHRLLTQLSVLEGVKFAACTLVDSSPPCQQLGWKFHFPHMLDSEVQGLSFKVNSEGADSKLEKKIQNKKLVWKTCSQLLKGKKKKIVSFWANFAAACSAYHQSRVEQVFFFSEKILFPEVTEAEERKSEWGVACTIMSWCTIIISKGKLKYFWQKKSLEWKRCWPW